MNPNDATFTADPKTSPPIHRVHPRMLAGTGRLQARQRQLKNQIAPLGGLFGQLIDMGETGETVLQDAREN